MVGSQNVTPCQTCNLVLKFVMRTRMVLTMDYFFSPLSCL